MPLETPQRIEPACLEVASVAIGDAVAELSAATATLGKALHPRTAANLAELVRIMNTYYSNLIEGHHTRTRDIQRALAGKFDKDKTRRNFPTLAYTPSTGLRESQPDEISCRKQQLMFAC